MRVPGSLAAVYLTMYHGSKTVSPATAIFEIIKRWLHRVQGQQLQHAHGLAAIHLRVGDVLELAEESDDMLHCVGGGAHVAWAGEPASRTYSVRGRHRYVRPAAYWEFIAEQLSQRRFRKVVLVAASGYNMTALAPTYPRSCRYIGTVSRIFGRAGLDVGYRLGKSPDADLAFFTTADAFVGSGGQYSTLASDVAALNNVTVIKAAPNVSGHPWMWQRGGTPVWRSTPATGMCVRPSAYTLLTRHTPRTFDPEYHTNAEARVGLGTSGVMHRMGSS